MIQSFSAHAHACLQQRWAGLHVRDDRGVGANWSVMLTGGDVDASASAASLLQSIYGSQASQLTFSSASSAARVAARPKSSPVSALLAREAAIRQAQRSLSRPPSAVLRPSSAHPRGSTYAHAQRPTPSRPRTAIGSVVRSALCWCMLVELWSPLP